MIEDKVGEDQLQIKCKIKIEKINQYKLDPTLNWKFAEITSLNDYELQFNIINKKIISEKKYL